jgi:hypothetical protein
MAGKRLTWSDLLIEDMSAEDLGPMLVGWSFLLGHDDVAPRFLNKFGSWFLERRSGVIEMLDVLLGEVRIVAPSFELFQALVNTQSWQEEFLLSETVYELHEVGTVPGHGQCYAIAPHPAVGGPLPTVEAGLPPRSVQVMSLRLWQSFCRQVFGGPP